MELTNEEKSILRILLTNELEYYEMKDDVFDDDLEYIKKLDIILKKIEDK